MTYTKHTWKIGDTISASYLNNIENEIDNRLPLKLFSSYQESTINGNNYSYYILNKTWQEIKNAYDANKLIIYSYNSEDDEAYSTLYNLTRTPYTFEEEEQTYYAIDFYSAPSGLFYTTNPNDYPATELTEMIIGRGGAR